MGIIAAGRYFLGLCIW
uniref:Uncharacterized protein n=1 Tax=Arundo donax TaxID=35708 RepID=A0A0A9BQI8_ARUDO